jgi:peptidoglycan/xylan/chitin deacetylase (PgdA/CDA1 family)
LPSAARCGSRRFVRSSLRLCAISVDLDEIPNYFQIHGLDAPNGASTAVYDVAIDRLMRFANDARLPLTLFAIGSDLARPEAAAKLRAARDAGHEMANHSLDHRYDLTKLDRAAIRSQIEGGADAIARATGERPIGFRAPGYTITDEVFDVLRELDVRYDSSVFPCPAYWALKTAAIGLIAARGRTSRSVVDTPAVLLAPTRPYVAGTPYWRRGDKLLELPVQVTRGLRMPFFGTSITMAGPGRARWLAKMCVGEPLINLELHGIDVLDARDGLEALRPHQPDVRVSTASKLASLHAVVDVLRAAGYSFVTLRDAASAF